MLRCGLLGKTLAHSYSPAVHGLLGDYEYRLYEKDEWELADFLRHGDFDGLNVTIPYKETVLPYCDELSAAAEKLKNVNTLIRRADGSLYGDNTDEAGFRYMLKKSGVDPKGKTVLILGNGGAAKTAAFVLNDLGAASVSRYSRHGDLPWQELKSRDDGQLLVNATPVGMFPETEQSPVDLRCFPRLEAVFDLIYNPPRTLLLKQSEELGIASFGGLSMLTAQAKRAAELFTGEAIADEKIAEIEAALSKEKEQTG